MRSSRGLDCGGPLCYIFADRNAITADKVHTLVFKVREEKPALPLLVKRVCFLLFIRMATFVVHGVCGLKTLALLAAAKSSHSFI